MPDVYTLAAYNNKMEKNRIKISMRGVSFAVWPVSYEEKDQ
jgi:hypothetical protein